MRITAEQQKIVDSLKCERLSDNLDNIRLVEDFVNSRNDSIAQTLRNEAFREDEDNILLRITLLKIQVIIFCFISH